MLAVTVSKSKGHFKEKLQLHKMFHLVLIPSFRFPSPLHFPFSENGYWIGLSEISAFWKNYFIFFQGFMGRKLPTNLFIKDDV